MEKSVFVSFFGWPEARKFVEKNAFWGILTSYCLLPDTFWLWASKNAFKKLAVQNSQKVTHCLPLWRKYAPEVKAAKGLKRCQAKIKGVNPAWTTQYSNMQCWQLQVGSSLVCTSFMLSHKMWREYLHGQICASFMLFYFLCCVACSIDNSNVQPMLVLCWDITYGMLVLCWGLTHVASVPPWSDLFMLVSYWVICGINTLNSSRLSHC